MLILRLEHIPIKTKIRILRVGSPYQKKEAFEDIIKVKTETHSFVERALPTSE